MVSSIETSILLHSMPIGGIIVLLWCYGACKPTMVNVIARKRNIFFCFLLFWESFNCYNFETAGPIQVGFSVKCTSPNEDFNDIENWKCHMTSDWFPKITSHIFKSVIKHTKKCPQLPYLEHTRSITTVIKQWMLFTI